MLKACVIGYGNMGRGTARALAASGDWDLAAVVDINPALGETVAAEHPSARFERDAAAVLDDPDIDLVALTTLADLRPDLLRRSLAAGKHVWAEKPLAATPAEEDALLETIEASGRHVAVNLFNRNAWYHDEAHAFIASGEIGEVAIIQYRHQTPGLLPTQGHAPEGPPFHDCGMHYVDAVRWYAGSEYDTWHAQGMRMWGHRDPWWVTVHGRFANGVVFQLTQGFVHGHFQRDRTVSCGFEIVGTRGTITFEHDFDQGRLHCHGEHRTTETVRPYGGKKFDVMATRLAEAINGGPVRYPTARDSVIASRVAWEMLEAAAEADPPNHGAPEQLRELLARRQAAT